MLQAERYALLFLIKLQDDEVEFLLRLDHIVRMPHATPAQVGQVQQAIDAAQVNEGAVIGNVLYRAVYDLAFLQVFHQLRALGVQLFFEQRAAADHDVSAAAVELGDAHLNIGADQAIEILRGAQVVLRAWQEGANSADVDNQPALDAVYDFCRDGFLGLVLRVNLFPGAAAIDLLIGDDGEAVFGLAGALHLNRSVRLWPRNLGLRRILPRG